MFHSVGVVILRLFICFYFGLDIKKEIEAVSKKHREQEINLLWNKRDSQASKQIEKEITALKMRTDFLKSPLMLERCNEAIARDKRQLEQLEYERKMEEEIRMDCT